MAGVFDSKNFNEKAFGKYMETVPKKRLNQLIKAGIFNSNSEIRDMFKNQTGSYYAEIPMYGRISGDASNYDGNTKIERTSMDTYLRGVVTFGRAQGFEEKDFSYDITSGVDFISQIGNQLSEYWDDVNEDVLLSIIKGIFGMTSTAGLEFVNTHTYDITAVDDGTVQSTTLNNAIQKASGDKKQVYSLAIIHSAIATNLENQKLLTYLTYTTPEGLEVPLNIGSWNGKLVLVDDTVTYDSDTGNYISYALGKGAFDYEDLGVKVPYETDRDPETNGGIDLLYSRERLCIAPHGISFTKSNVASFSPTNEEFEDGANWDIVTNTAGNDYFDIKEIPIVKIVSLG